MDLETLTVSFGADLAGLASGVTGAKALLGGFALGAIGVGVAAVKMAGDFQASMTSLVTGAGESQKNIGMVSQGILDMAVKTGTGTKQLSDGMYMIESAGFHGADGLKVLQAAAEGAKVGNADLGVVADGVTTLMVDYKNKNVTAAQATNDLIATVANGKTHMQDLASSMAMILPTASAVGVGMIDVSGAMATMTGEGVPAADAATYLRQMLMALESPAKSGSKALAEIGLSSKDVSDAMKVSLPGALQMIEDHLKKKFPEGSAGYINALKNIAGGSKQMQGMLDLTGQHLETFKGNVGSIGDAVKKGGNDIAGWSDVQKDFNFKLSQASAAAEVLMITLGSKLLPILSPLIGAIATMIGQFTSWMSSGHAVADAFSLTGKYAQIVLPILGALGAMVLAVIVPSFWAWASATLAATWPILAIGAAVAAIVAIFVLLYQKNAGFRGFIDGVAAAFMQLAGFVQANFIPTIQSIGGFLSAVVGWFVQWHGIILTVAGVILTFFLPALIAVGLKALVSGAQIAAGFIANMITTGAQAVVQAAKVTASFIASMVQAGAQAWIQGPKVVAGFVSSMVTTGAQAVVQAAKVTASFIASMVQAGAKAVVAAAQITASFVASLVAAAAQAATTAATFLATLIPALVSTAAEAVVAAVTAIPGLIAGFIAWAGAAWAAAAGTIAATWPILLIIVAIAAVIAIIVLLVTHWKQVSAFAVQIWTAIVQFFQNNVVKPIGAFFDQVGTKIHQAIQFAGLVFSQFGKQVHNVVFGIIGWFQALPGNVLKFIDQFILNAVNRFKNLWNMLITDAKNILGGLGSAISGVFKGGINLLIGGINWIIDQIDRIHVSTPLGSIGFAIPHIPYLARGGTVPPGSVAVAGEAGPELVFGGSGGASVMSASQTAALMGGGRGGSKQPLIVPVMLNGREIARAMVDDLGEAMASQMRSSGHPVGGL